MSTVTEEGPTVADPLPPGPLGSHPLPHHHVVLALREEQLVLRGAASARDLAPWQRKVLRYIGSRDVINSPAYCGCI